MLHLKTDAELRFFVENPSYYQAELVVAARQELRRRQPIVARPPEPAAAPPAAAPLAPAAASPTETDYAAAPPRPATSWLLPASVASVLLLAGLGFWGKARQQQPALASAPPRAQPAARPPAAPANTLETAIAAPALPTYSADGYIKQALTKVPAGEKADEQLLAQYQAISRLFWMAQQPSAHLIAQARQGTPNPMFAAQASFVLGLWQDFDRTLSYSYHFGPVMDDHFGRMKTIAKQQRAALVALANAAAARQPLRLTAAELEGGQQALPQLLAPLQPAPGATAHL